MSLPRSVALKLDRAAEHVHALQEAQEAFLAGKPYTYRRTIEGGTCEEEGTDHVFRWERYTAPPDSLGLIAGDAIHNARSALDHLAVALAEYGARVAGVTMTPRVEAGIQFPICFSHDQFVEQIRRGRLEHVERSARAIIEACQPYRISNNPERAVLMQLSRLDNADKHRTLLAAGHAVSVRPGDIPGAEVKPPADPPTPGDSYGEPGTEICRIVLDAPKREVDVPCELGFGVVLLGGIAPFAEMHMAIGDIIAPVETFAETIAGKCLRCPVTVGTSIPPVKGYM